MHTNYNNLGIKLWTEKVKIIFKTAQSFGKKSTRSIFEPQLTRTHLSTLFTFLSSKNTTSSCGRLRIPAVLIAAILPVFISAADGCHLHVWIFPSNFRIDSAILRLVLVLSSSWSRNYGCHFRFFTAAPLGFSTSQAGRWLQLIARAHSLTDSPRLMFARKRSDCSQPGGLRATVELCDKTPLSTSTRDSWEMELIILKTWPLLNRILRLWTEFVIVANFVELTLNVPDTVERQILYATTSDSTQKYSVGSSHESKTWGRRL